MKTSITHLPANKQAEIKRIKDALIPKYAEIEMIIQFGSHARGDWKISESFPIHSAATARGAEHPN